MIIALLAVFAIFLCFLLAAGKRYDYVTDKVSKETYPFKALLPGALLILDLTGCRFGGSYNRKKASVMTRLYGGDQRMDQLRLFWANRLTYIFNCTVPAALSGAAAQSADIETALFWAVLSVLAVFMTEREPEKRLRKRTRSIQMELPDFINKLALLINAGLNLRKAWQKIASEAKKTTPLYKELELVAEDLALGRSEPAAFENFAKRCGIPEVTRLVTVIVQNIRRGNSDMVSVLRISANECWQMRKNAARRLGEEASTKLLFPLVLMLMAVLIISAAPAVIAMGLF